MLNCVIASGYRAYITGSAVSCFRASFYRETTITLTGHRINIETVTTSRFLGHACTVDIISIQHCFASVALLVLHIFALDMYHQSKENKKCTTALNSELDMVKYVNRSVKCNSELKSIETFPERKTWPII